MRIVKSDKISPPGYAVAIGHHAEGYDVKNFASKADVLNVSHLGFTMFSVQFTIYIFQIHKYHIHETLHR